MICIELAAILILNSGALVFTLDDPYIHFALAENILHGHYGLSMAEYSSPSSSILWPFLIAPFLLFRVSVYAFLLLNVLSSVGALILFWKILQPPGADSEITPDKSNLLSLALIIAVVAVNMVGLIFTGMEHSLQLFLSVLIIFGMTRELKTNVIPWWTFAAIIIAPLIRYECLALSVPALVFLGIRGHRAAAFVSALLIVFLLAAFSGFLLSLGLPPLPLSVLVKSAFGKQGSIVKNILDNFHAGISSPRGIVLIVCMLILSYSGAMKTRRKAERLFACTVAASIFMHLLLGRYGWSNRYEIYIFAAAIMALFHSYKAWYFGLASEKKVRIPVIISLMTLATFLLCAPYIFGLATIPLASNNVYEQHFQMHRFVTEYYKASAAVNDVGYVSYGNSSYVLDLYGLSSLETFGRPTPDVDDSWVDGLVRKKNIRFAMIYEGWFKHIPASWRKVGELRLGKVLVSPAYASVSFYALDEDTFDRVRTLAAEFRMTLPTGAQFVFTDAPRQK